MHSFLILSKDKKAGFDQIDKILKSEEISEFDKNYFTFDEPVGIEDIRHVQGKLHLKPFKSKKRAMILDFSTGATVQAQNSMLKILEEPPPSTIILIYGKSSEDFLPTILSRCKIIETSGAEAEELGLDIQKLLKAGVGDKLEIAQRFGGDRETALQTIESTIFAIEKELPKIKKEELRDYLNLMKALSSCYSDLKFSNVNPRFILENYLLQI